MVSIICLYELSLFLALTNIEPAHSQMAENRSAYIILSLLKDGTISDNEALLSFSYDLIELASEQGAFLLLSTANLI